MTGIPKGTFLVPSLSADEAIRWIVQEAGRDAWLKRAKELGETGSAFTSELIMERHHIELCIAAGLQQLETGGSLTQFEQPFVDAFVFAGVANALHARLTPQGQRRHRGKLKQALKNDYGFAALRTEYSAMFMGLGIGCDVLPTDYEGIANYDLLFSDGEDEIELECKLLTHDFGHAFRRSDYQRLCVALASFERSDLLRPGTSHIAWLTVREALPRKSEDLRSLASAVASAVSDQQYLLPEYVDELRIEEWPLGVTEPARAHAEARFITVFRGQTTFALHGERSAFILAIRSAADKSSWFSDHVVRKFKEATDQLSGTRPGAIFAEVEGPCFDTPVIHMVRDTFEKLLQEVFKARPFLELVILGFPGPPFSVGVSFPIRNPRVKRRNLSFISRKLERYSRPWRSKNIPFREFRKDWWQRKYRWDHKSAEDVTEAVKSATATTEKP